MSFETETESETVGYLDTDPVHHPVKGIRNHGNTCFFNAMLQAVNQTDEFHNLYVMKPYEKEYPVMDQVYSVSAPQPNEVAKMLCQTFDQFTNSDNQYISTRNLLKTLGKRHPRFVQGSQEDSHEVLRALLDGIKSEEIENIKKEIRLQFDAKHHDSFQDGQQNSELKGHLRMASKVDVAISKVVQGSIISVVICHECHSVVENIEPFFDLSLPILDKTSTEKPALSSDDEENNCESLTLGKRKRKSNSTEGSPTKKRRTNTIPSDVSDGTSCGDDPSQAVLVQDKATFQNYLRKNGYKHLYDHSNQKTTAHEYDTDLEHCLSAFTDLDVLDEDNKFICKSCSEKKQQSNDFKISEVDSNEYTFVLCRVSKQLMIHQLPPVLILHIKRFEIGQYRVTKDSRYISFPEILDLAPYCTVECVKERGDSNNKILYGLYAVVVHHGGSLYSGHYVSYVKTRPSKVEMNKDTDDEYHRIEYDKDYCNKGQWHIANDTYVEKCQFKDVKDSEAYMLFYELLPTVKHYHQSTAPNLNKGTFACHDSSNE